MAARGGDEQGPFHRLLPPDVPEILVIGRRGRHQLRRLRGDGRQGLPPAQKLHDLGEALGGINVDPLDHPGLPGVGLGDDQGQTRRPGGQGHGEHPPGGFEAAVQGKLPVEEIVLRRGRRQQALGGQDTHGHRQVEAGALLADVGRG